MKAGNAYDSDEEREKAHRMFSDDLQDLRKLFLKIMDDQIQTQEEMQTNFNREREFFLNSASDSQANVKGLKEIID